MTIRKPFAVGMCSNYRPVTRLDRLLTFFGVERERDAPADDVFPLGVAPFIRLNPDFKDQLIADDGIFGLLPHFATELSYGRKTYNARSETVHRLPSFKDSWSGGRRCVIPAEAVYEPNWETGKAVRWRIGQPGDVPMGIAGIYLPWRTPDGRELLTFAMLTVNANDHPVMRRFHRPGEEKRMVVILEPDQYLPWLTCSLKNAPAHFQMFRGPLDAEPAALPQRIPRADSRTVIPTKRPLPGPDLFDVDG